MTEDEMVDGITDSMDMSLSKLRETVKDREAWSAAVHGARKTGQDLMTGKQYSSKLRFPCSGLCASAEAPWAPWIRFPCALELC